jgi:hypothetical protein
MTALTLIAASEHLNDFAKSALTHTISELPRTINDRCYYKSRISVVFTLPHLPEMGDLPFLSAGRRLVGTEIGKLSLELVDRMSANGECGNDLTHRHVSQMTYITAIIAPVIILASSGGVVSVAG